MDDKKNHAIGSTHHSDNGKETSGLVEVAGLKQDTSVREIRAEKMDAILQKEEVIDLTELADSVSEVQEADAPKQATADRKKTGKPAQTETDEKKPDSPAQTGADGKKPGSPKQTGADGKKPGSPAQTGTDGKKPDSPKQAENGRRTPVTTEKPEDGRKNTVKSGATKETQDGKDASGNSGGQAGEKKKSTPQDKEHEAGEDVTQELAVSEAYESKNPVIPADRTQKFLRIGLSSVAALLLLIYAAGAIYYSGHFYKDATINGVDVSGMKVQEADQALEDFYEHYVLNLKTISADDIEIDGDDISIKISPAEQAESVIRKQGAARWFINAFEPHAYEVHVNTSWDQNALDGILASLDILNEKKMKSPQDAHVGVEDGKFAIIAEKNGNTILPGQFTKIVEKALSEVQKEVDLVEYGCYLLPKVHADDPELKQELEQKRAYESKSVTLKLDDLAIEPGMELYDKVLEKNGTSFSVSRKLVREYVAELAKQYNTVGSDRSFVTSFQDKEIQVTGPSYGYEMDEEATAEALYRALSGGTEKTVDVVFIKTGSTLLGKNDIGKTYIEVNLSEQRVIAYKNGRVIAEGDCVSGNESEGHGTCIGLYAIQNKQSPTVLRGEKKPVTRTITKKKKGKKITETKTTYEYEYESPVTYWMPFNGGIGLHDAAGWRSAYGGSIYYYSGSHGCVNLPLDLAKNIYNNFDIGTPVVVYFWDNENRK